MDYHPKEEDQHGIQYPPVGCSTKYNREIQEIGKGQQSVPHAESNTTCNKILKAIVELCGIKTHLTYHVARHSAATTILLSNGVSIEPVSRLLGHTDIKTTSRLYNGR